MNIKGKIELIKRNTQEILREKDLDKVLKGKNLSVYCGYEPSGEIHLGHLVTLTKLLDFQKVGVNVIVLLADWHAWLNKKGDWDFLNKQVKSWEKGIKAAGLRKARFVKGTDFQRKKEYIDEVMLMALETTVNRGLRSMQVVARDVENAKISQIIYPLMQIEDIKDLNVDFVCAGIDQRKIHALGIELENKINIKKKSIYVHTPIISSLKGPGSKMSSSDPGSFISIRDNKNEIRKKTNSAYCPIKQVKENPIIEIVKFVIFPRFEKIIIKRDKKFGGDVDYRIYEDLEKDYKNGKLHPADLKNSVAEYLDKIIEPIRKTWK